jgi:uncharacterized protein (DUF58 family)
MTEAGSGELTRFEAGLLALMLLGFSVDASHENAGGVFFNGNSLSVWKPARGKAHLLAMLDGAMGMRDILLGSVRDAATSNASRTSKGPMESPRASNGPSLSSALLAASAFCKKRSLVVVFSDFLDAPGWEKELIRLSRRSQCVCVRITDPIEKTFSGSGFTTIADTESGRRMRVQTSSPRFRKLWLDFWARHQFAWKTACAHTGAAAWTLSTEKRSEVAEQVLNIFSGSHVHAGGLV